MGKLKLGCYKGVQRENGLNTEVFVSIIGPEWYSKLRNITFCGNQSARDMEELCSVNVDAW